MTSADCILRAQTSQLLDCQVCHHRFDQDARDRGQEIRHLCQLLDPVRWNCYDPHDRELRPYQRISAYRLTAISLAQWPEEMVKAFSPDFVAPVVGYLTSEANDETTYGLYEVTAGGCAAYRWQRTYGYAFPVNAKVTPEAVKAKWDVITRFDDKATNPASTAESLESVSDAGRV